MIFVIISQKSAFNHWHFFMRNKINYGWIPKKASEELFLI